MPRLTVARVLAASLVALSAACSTPPTSAPPDGGEPEADAGSGPDTGRTCSTGAECDDGVFCNGAERCAPGTLNADARGCAPPNGPACPIDQTCDEPSDRCMFACQDADEDGAAAQSCGGTDCDDSDPARHPDATEVCDDARLDEDCDPSTHGERDRDRDGFDDLACCNGSNCGEDCDDRRRSTNPETSEVCDGLDNDCDGETDEEVAIAGYWDEDLDGSGDPARPRLGCAGDLRLALSPGDCNDDEPHASHLLPEVCDTIDNDCDGETDENPRPLPWYLDDDGDGYASPHDDDVIVACDPPSDRHVLLPLDCDDTDSMRSPRNVEICDGVDNDCNGWPDFFIGPFDYEDDDRDRTADMACGGTDCEDTDIGTFPNAPEITDGADQDCDGRIDESPGTRTYYRDGDSDGAGDPQMSMSATIAPAGYVLAGGDCDDSDPATHPDALETCDGEDDDCDMRVDEGAASTPLYADRDRDGSGDARAARLFCVVGAPPEGWVSTDDDCDDESNARYPGAPERCDDIDQDCDRAIDDAPSCPLMIYLTTGYYTGGGLNGEAGADALCNSDPGHPGGQYKALLWGPLRYPCTTPGCSGADMPRDWVIRPNTTYRVRGGVFFTSDAEGLVNYPLMTVVSSSVINFWAGAAADLTVNPVNCGGWTSGSSGQGAVGWTASTSASWLTGGQLACNISRPIVCVQQ